MAFIAAEVANSQVSLKVLAIFSAIAAVLLIAQAAFPEFVSEAEPGRFNDYVDYIGRIEEKTQRFEGGHQLSTDTWNTLTRNELSLGLAHFHHVANKWPWIDKHIEALPGKPSARSNP